jgi:hypothetical protein
MVAFEQTIRIPRVVEKRIPVTYMRQVPRVVVMRVPINPCEETPCCGGAPAAVVVPAPVPAPAPAPAYAPPAQQQQQPPTGTFQRSQPTPAERRPTEQAPRTREPSGREQNGADQPPRLSPGEKVGPVDEESDSASPPADNTDADSNT